MIDRFGRKASLLRSFFLIFSVLVLVLLVAAGLPEKFSFTAAPPTSRKVNPIHSDEMRKRELTARFDQGVAMLQMGEFEHAVTAFHRVLVLAPELPEAHLNMGFALFELNDYHGAQRFFLGAKALAPNLISAEYGLAVSLFAQGKTTEAVHHMATYLDGLNKDDPFRKRAEDKMKNMKSALMAQQKGRLASD